MLLAANAAAVGQDLKGSTEGTTKDFEATGEFKGIAQEQKLLHVEQASDPDAREQDTRMTIRANCVGEKIDPALCDRITGLDVNKDKNK
jgi:hypothetical protein